MLRDTSTPKGEQRKRNCNQRTVRNRKRTKQENNGVPHAKTGERTSSRYSQTYQRLCCTQAALQNRKRPAPRHQGSKQTFALSKVTLMSLTLLGTKPEV